MSDSGTLTIKFESVAGHQEKFSTDINTFIELYQSTTNTLVSVNDDNTFEFYFDRCYNFKSIELTICSLGLNLIAHVVYSINDDGTSQDQNYIVQDGFLRTVCDEYENDYVDLQDLYE